MYNTPQDRLHRTDFYRCMIHLWKENHWLSSWQSIGLHIYHLKTVAEDSRTEGCDAVSVGK